MTSPDLFCAHCGAANAAMATTCFACGSPLSQDDPLPIQTATTTHTATVSSSPAITGQLAHDHLLKGRYRILKQIGTGGFGAVYQAQDLQRNNALVAIKSINLHRLSPEQIIEATDTFNREVGMLSELEHPNLPHIYEHFTDPEHWYLVMDFIEGETLEHYLNKAPGGRLPLSEVLDMGMQLCTVLDYLHSQQPPIIFRDVKPGNIMRTSSGHLYLIDFGIARHFTPGQARDTMPLGSPGYAPPEQYGRAQTTVQSDIYSLGATLRFLLTGKEPSEAFPSPASSYIQEVPVELQQLLGQMLEWDASKRPASMEAVKRTLQQIRDAHLLYTYRGHSDWVHAVAWSPDGKRIASGGGDKTVQVWDAAGGRNVFTYRGHSLDVFAVAWSPDGKCIASGSWDQTVQVWDAADGGHIYTYRGHSAPVYAVAWSPDGKRIASGDLDGTAQVWDATNGRNVYTHRGHSSLVNAVAWSPDGRRIASGGDDTTVQLWDATNGRNVYTYRGHSSFVWAVAWSPDGRRIASGSADKTVQVWDATNGRNVYTYRGHSSFVWVVAWSPDGRRIASGSQDGTVQVWDAADGGHVYTYRGHSAPVYAVAWSPDGRRIASGSADKTVQV